MKSILLIALGVSLTWCLPTWCQQADDSKPNTTAWLVEACRTHSKERGTLTNVDNMKLSFCGGYMAALMELRDVQVPKERLFCVPEGASVGQMAKVFVKYADQHPERLHHPRMILVTDALQQAFPCH